VAFFTNNHIKFNNFSITNTSNSFSGVVTGDSSLMDKDVFFGVIAIDEAISTLHIKPFDHTGHFGSNYLLFRGSLLLFGLVFRVGHDV